MIKYQVYTSKDKQVILPEGEITKAIWDSKKSELDTYRITQTNKILTDLRSRTKKDSKNDHRAIFMDLANGVIIWARLLAGDTLTDPKVATEYFYLRTPKGATDISFTELFSNWEIPSGNAKVDKIIKELFEKYIELQKTELTGKTIDQIALKNELINLIKKYIDTKVEGVAAGSTNIINDTTANTTQTYSSSKLDNLLQDVLRQSDTSETSTASKLVKRNSQGIIYASNISLDAPTKVEYTDVKNSLASDKWRFMVKDTDDGLLKAISIKDFVGSQNQTETLAAKVDVDTYNTFVNTTTNALGSKVDHSEANKPNGYSQLDAEGKISANQLPANISASSLTGQAKAAVDAKLDASTIIDNSTLKINVNILPSNLVYTQPDRKIPISAIPLKDDIKILNGPGGYINLNWYAAKHFILNIGTKSIFQIDDFKTCIGQTGVIIVNGADKISGWGSSLRWRKVPTELKTTEIFAYFVASANSVYMGRA